MTEEHVVDRLERSGAEEDGADRDRAESQRREPQRCEHRERPEEQRGEEDEPARAEDRAVAEGADESGWILRLVGDGGGRQRSPGDECERRDRERPERPADPGHRRDAADDRPEERATDGRGERAPDQRAALRGRRRGDEPAECAGPRERARHSLQEAGEVELPRFLAETEEHGADRDRRHPDEHRELQAEASGEDAARDRAEERSGGVRSREDARARLAERELVGEVGQKRRQRREEERVEEDDGARQQKQVAHPASLRTELERALPTAVTLLIRDEGRIRSHPGRARGSGSGAGRDRVPARRSRLGPRGRHEPVGR